MRIRHTTSSGGDKIELQMTPMIDIVFQLLVFFIMTFKIVAMEGDFNIRMPLASQGGAPDDALLPPLKLYLTADEAGNLVWPIVLNEQPLESWDQLQGYVADLIGDPSGPSDLQDSAEVELHCDYQLRYNNVIQAIDHVRGRKDPNTGEVIELVKKIKFAPPAQGAL